MFFFNLNLYFVLLSTIFFYLLFNGYFNIRQINNILNNYSFIGITLKFIGSLLIICLTLYYFIDVIDPQINYLKAPNVSTGDINNTLHIVDSNIYIPKLIANGLTNIGTGAAVAAGLKAGSSIAKGTGLPPAAKIGIMAVGALIGGSTVSVINSINSITTKKIDSSIQSTTPPSNSNNGSAFSIEPGVDLDTVINLLNANFILHLCILYLIVALIVLYLSTMVVDKHWNLIFIQNILGKWFYNLFIKALIFTGKNNRIWMYIASILLIFSILITLYISYFILNNIDIITQIVANTKR
uniref:Uncharacterized protein n=1 Tax=Cordyceps pruinosa TaxID=129524 RepID=A0A8K1E1U5_9HYPO|nr:hypothetical protein MFQ26_mgp10 [Cordyceps pruinosa]QQA36261.1 hypothetical protein [Cordyceps pruinosa]